MSAEHMYEIPESRLRELTEEVARLRAGIEEVREWARRTPDDARSTGSIVSDRLTALLQSTSSEGVGRG